MRRSAVLAALLALAAGPALAQEAAVPLAQHRAVYDLSLARSAGARNVESAKGRIVFDFTGDACAGYSLNYRQVTVLETSENGSKSSDLRNITFEDGEGRGYRFKTEQTTDGSPAAPIDGSAETKEGGRIAVKLRAPKPDAFELPAGTIYPTVHLKRLIAAGKAGQSTLEAPVFDGSDDGRKVYDTLAIIGRRIEPGTTEGLEEQAKQAGLARYARWPITLSYYAPGDGERTPAYTLSFELYENGVSRALKLDYGEFALLGEMSKLDLIPGSGGCAKP